MSFGIQLLGLMCIYIYIYIYIYISFFGVIFSATSHSIYLDMHIIVSKKKKKRRYAYFSTYLAYLIYVQFLKILWFIWIDGEEGGVE